MRPSRSTVAAALLYLSLVLAHGDEEGHDGDMKMSNPVANLPAGNVEVDLYEMPSYAGLELHTSLIVTHIVLMVLAWFFILPFGTSQLVRCPCAVLGLTDHGQPSCSA